jgi:hypothetical protein
MPTFSGYSKHTTDRFIRNVVPTRLHGVTFKTTLYIYIYRVYNNACYINDLLADFQQKCLRPRKLFLLVHRILYDAPEYTFICKTQFIVDSQLVTATTTYKSTAA